MKKGITLLMVSSLLAMSLPVSAETGRSNLEIKAEIEARRASTTRRIMEVRANMEARKASSTERRIEIGQDLAKRKSENVARVLKQVITHLEKIISRIESRIAKIKAEGGVTAESEAFIAAAKVNLEDAKTTIDGFVNLDLTSDKAKDNFEKVRLAAAEAKEHIRAAHQNLMKAVRLLKSAVP